MSEIWKKVIGWEDLYEVSNSGRVRSLDRIIVKKNRHGSYSRCLYKGRVLSPGDTGGCLFIVLSRDSYTRKFTVHELVLEAFVCPRPPGLEGCHWDGNYKNNRVENLRWDTHKGNHQDRIRHGTSNRGEKNASAKLNPDKVREMRELYKTGKYSQNKLAKMYGLAKNYGRLVLKNITWKHVV